MKKLLLLLFLPLLLAAGCTKGPYIEDTGVELYFSDEQGNDLLDPACTSPKAIDVTKIRLYEVVDGKEKMFYRPDLSATNGVVLVPSRQGHARYHANFSFVEGAKNNATSILKWPDGRRDVFKAELYHDLYATGIERLWLNDSLVWAARTNGNPPRCEITR